MLNLETFGEDELYLTVEADMDGYVDKENCDINRSFLNYWFVYPKLNIDTIYEFLRAWADIAAMKWGYDNKSDWLDSLEYELMDKRIRIGDNYDLYAGRAYEIDILFGHSEWNFSGDYSLEKGNLMFLSQIGFLDELSLKQQEMVLVDPELLTENQVSGLKRSFLSHCTSTDLKRKLGMQCRREKWLPEEFDNGKICEFRK